MNVKNKPWPIIFLVLFLLSCAGEEVDRSHLKVFHYNQPNSVTSLDPAFARSQNNIWAVDHLYNALVQLDDTLNVRPCLAHSWDLSDDGLTYTFHLRDDVYFHDDPAFENGKGRKLLAQDVVYSLGRILDKKVGSPGGWIFKGKIAEEQPFSAPDDSTFVLKLKAPFRPMMGILTMQYCCVVPREAIEKYGKTFREHPVGTGPFQFKRWMENQALFLKKNENYFEKDQGRQLPLVDGIRLSFINDRKTAYLELMNGRIDFMSGLESSFINELLTPDGELQYNLRDQLQFLKSPYLNMEYLGFNMQSKTPNNPLLIKEVRQALNYGIDRDLMLRTMRNDVGKAADSGFTPRGLPSHDPSIVKGYQYDPDKASQLLADAGFPNGEGMPEIKLMTNKDYEDLCTFCARQWEDLGIPVKVDILESATLREMMSKGQADFFRASWIADYPDPETFVTMFYGKHPAPPNYTRFRNAELDVLYEKALLENDDVLRKALYQEMDRILIEEAPVVFLFYDETAVFAKRSIEGLSRNAVNLLSVKRIEKVD